MSEIKPVYVKTGAQKIAEIEAELGATTDEEQLLYYKEEATELRAAYEALQKDLGLAKLALESKRNLLTSCEAALEQSQAENAAQAKRIAELEQSQLNEVINLRTRNAQLQAKMDQFAEVLKQHNQIDPFDLVNRLGTILLSAPEPTKDE